jgi:predicted phage gp36 major capsid-like protein
MAVRLRPDRLTQFGFRPVEVLEALQTSYQGAVVVSNQAFKVLAVSMKLKVPGGLVDSD